MCFAQLLAHDLGQLDVTVFDRAVKWVGLANVQLRVLENADDHARDVDAGYWCKATVRVKRCDVTAWRIRCDV